MMFFKMCPRCRGDVYLSQDTYGRYKECLQCGYLEDLEAREFVRPLRQEEREAA